MLWERPQKDSLCLWREVREECSMYAITEFTNTPTLQPRILLEGLEPTKVIHTHMAGQQEALFSMFNGGV